MSNLAFIFGHGKIEPLWGNRTENIFSAKQLGFTYWSGMGLFHEAGHSSGKPTFIPFSVTNTNTSNSFRNRQDPSRYWPDVRHFQVFYQLTMTWFNRNCFLSSLLFHTFNHSVFVLHYKNLFTHPNVQVESEISGLYLQTYKILVQSSIDMSSSIDLRR